MLRREPEEKERGREKRKREKERERKTQRERARRKRERARRENESEQEAEETEKATRFFFLNFFSFHLQSLSRFFFVLKVGNECFVCILSSSKKREGQLNECVFCCYRKRGGQTREKNKRVSGSSRHQPPL